MTVQHPVKIDAFADLRCQRSYLRIIAEILARGQHPAQQQGGVDR